LTGLHCPNGSLSRSCRLSRPRPRAEVLQQRTAAPHLHGVDLGAGFCMLRECVKTSALSLARISFGPKTLGFCDISLNPRRHVQWHRAGFRLFWRWKSCPHKSGRKTIAPDTIHLILHRLILAGGFNRLQVLESGEFEWFLGATHLPSILATTKMTKAPKRPPPPRRYINE
jgi:hypothetical protein